MDENIQFNSTKKQIPLLLNIYRMDDEERMERRERDRRERAKMSMTQNPEPEPEMPYFPALVRVRFEYD